MTRALRLIIFDVDGTLVDSQGLIATCMIKAFEATSRVAPEPKNVKDIIGLSLPKAFEQLCPSANAQERRNLTEAYISAVMATRETQSEQISSPLYPGIRSLLDSLLRFPETLMGVATGKSWRGLDHVIRAHGFEQHFVTCQVADNHPSKPHPSMILTALSETGCDAAQAVMVGDTVYDMQMAAAAGIAAVGVNWGYHDKARLQEAGAQHIAMDADHLAQILQNLDTGR